MQQPIRNLHSFHAMQTAATPRLPDDLLADIHTLDAEMRRHQEGGCTDAEIKPKRGLRGIYEERTTGSFMLRARVPGGVLPQAQAAAIAALGQKFGDGRLHLTTRQDIQFHGVPHADLIPLMHALLHAGIACKGGGGNAVRNHAICPHAGACIHESFDVTAAAHATAEFLLANPGSYTLPRKFKIAFSGCAADCALAKICDLGFLAAVRDGQPGFRVYIGGGMGAFSRRGDLLYDWIAASEIFRVAEAARRIFDRLGDRTNRARARLRFVCDRLGPAQFRQEFEAQFAEVARDKVPAWDGIPVLNPNASAPPAAGAPRPVAVAGLRIFAQRQPGFASVLLHAPLGYLPATDLAILAADVIPFSREHAIRLTRNQSLLLRHVALADLPDLAAALRTLSTNLVAPAAIDRFTACVGAATCRIGLCQARGAARACADHLMQQGVSRDVLEAMEFHFNGCANACGHQPVAAIGARGIVLSLQGRRVPAYDVTLGGSCDARGVRLGISAGRVPAASLPVVMHALAATFAAQRQAGETFVACLDRIGIALFQDVVARHALHEGGPIPENWMHDLCDPAHEPRSPSRSSCPPAAFGVSSSPSS